MIYVCFSSSLGNAKRSEVFLYPKGCWLFRGLFQYRLSKGSFKETLNYARLLDARVKFFRIQGIYKGTIQSR